MDLSSRATAKNYNFRMEDTRRVRTLENSIPAGTITCLLIRNRFKLTV